MPLLLFIFKPLLVSFSRFTGRFQTNKKLSHLVSWFMKNSYRAISARQTSGDVSTLFKYIQIITLALKVVPFLGGIFCEISLESAKIQQYSIRPLAPWCLHVWSTRCWHPCEPITCHLWICKEAALDKSLPKGKDCPWHLTSKLPKLASNWFHMIANVASSCLKRGVAQKSQLDR